MASKPLCARTLRAVANKIRKLAETDLVLIQSAQLRSDYGDQARYGWRYSWNMLWAGDLEKEARALTKPRPAAKKPKAARKRKP